MYVCMYVPDTDLHMLHTVEPNSPIRTICYENSCVPHIRTCTQLSMVTVHYAGGYRIVAV